MIRVNDRMIEKEIGNINDYFADNGIGLSIETFSRSVCPGLLLTETEGVQNSASSFATKRRTYQALSRFSSMLRITGIKDIRKIELIFDKC